MILSARYDSFKLLHISTQTSSNIHISHNLIRHYFIWMENKTELQRITLRLTVLIFLLAQGLLLFSHGTVTSPPSRVWNCYSENPESPVTPPCIASVSNYGTQHLYDWNGIRQGNANGNHQSVIPDGQLASGGDPDKYGGLDAVGSDWKTTSVAAGPFTVTWTNSAPHATLYYDVYITSSDWTPDQPLTWDKLELLVTTDPSGAESEVDISVVLPARSGHHVIYSVWQRSDSPEAFYSTSDVDFGDVVIDDGGGNIPTKVTVGENLVVNGDVYLNGHSGTDTRNLVVEADGKISVGITTLSTIENSTDITQQYRFNKFNFSQSKELENRWIMREGIYLKDGHKINGLSAFMLNPNDGIAFRLFRMSKTEISKNAEMLIYINSGGKNAEAYEKHSTETIEKNKQVMVVNNEKYIYFLEVEGCKECDFTEVIIY